MDLVIGAAFVLLVVGLAVGITLAAQQRGTSSPPASPSASASASASATSTPTSSATPEALPSRSPSPITRTTPARTDGPCGYAETAQQLGGGYFDIGLPADPKTQPIRSQVVTVRFRTNRGPITAVLDSRHAPCNAQSLVHLISRGFYDDTACSRSGDASFGIVQCGDPTATGSSGPTYRVRDEALSSADYVAGTIAMANSGANTNGSQFFFLTGDLNSTLAKSYTVVGHVTAGLPILRAVVAGGNDGSNAAGGGVPKRSLVFEKVTASSRKAS